MRMLSRHPGRALTIGIGAVALAALAANGPVAAGESGAQVESGDAVSQPVSDMAPMIEPMEDVDE